MILYSQAEQLFPYGSHLLRRNPRTVVFGEAPICFECAKDAHFWDVDGNEFIDCGLVPKPATLGYCYAPVDPAAKAQIDRGVMGTINHAVEVEMAEAFCDMVPRAEMVKFCQSGAGTDAGKRVVSHR